MIKEKQTAGFTLLETLLSLFIVSLLSSVLILNTNILVRPSKFIDSVKQVEGLLRYTKAEAAIQGKKMTVNVKDREIRYENNKVFTNSFVESLDYLEYINIHLYVNIHLETDIENEIADAEEKNIEFYPDGSSDSSSLIISEKENGKKKYILMINGIVGSIKGEIVE